MRTIDPGVLKGKYAVYVIVTPLKGYYVERRYSDFLSMRKELMRLYPGYVIPPMPVKRLANNLEPAFLQERKTLLQHFLSDILKHPILRNCELFTQFISLSSKEWEERAKCFSKPILPREIAQYVTVSGEAKLHYSAEALAYCERLNGTVKDMAEIFKELKLVNQSIIGELERLSSSFNKAAVLYQRLSSLYLTLEYKTHADLFFCMGGGSASLGEAYRAYKEEYADQLGEYYSFYCRELLAIDELIQTQKATGEHMETAEKKLRRKKEQKFEQKNTATWELESSALSNAGVLLENREVAFKEMLARESRDVQKIRMLYGYYINKVVEEFDRILTKDEHDFKTQFLKSILTFADREEYIKKAWNELLARIEKIELGRKVMPNEPGVATLLS
eukprot:TRINITY_DN7911_c0_g1_i1.p1 TRINITY_DN7911_c0_g1~~TRINITY_DN7911_c0_g1_i1.p1  ORF type:complete len:391 (-),score=152.57 TRINITY_DN7911_c0_g1_i1:133-1305(-)